MNTETLRVKVELNGTRLAAQPRWIRELVSDLMSGVRERDEKISELVGPRGTSTTHADPYSEHPVPLGINPVIAHDMEVDRTGQPDRFVIHCMPDRIEVRGDGLGRSFTIEPMASNVVQIMWRDKR